MKNEGNILTSLKDLASSNAQFRDQNCCSSFGKVMALVVLFGFFLYSFDDYYLFTCFSMAIN